uniref:Secreted protein n=2 Tax=Parascaris TaxID=6254 RepID=A0A915BLF2_PARUN
MSAALFIVSCVAVVSAFTLPAGLRPAKAVGDPQKAIVPGKQEPEPTPPHNGGSEETSSQSSREATARVPPNLSLRSRMMAALSAPPNATENSSKAQTSQNISSSANDSVVTKAPIIFSKSHKKGAAAVKSPVVATNNSNVRVAAAVPPKPGANNYGLNTVLQTNLVDSRGRVMKGVSVVPIKVPTSAEMKSGRTRHTARVVESDADKVVPIKFGSAGRH